MVPLLTRSTSESSDGQKEQRIFATFDFFFNGHVVGVIACPIDTVPQTRDVPNDNFNVPVAISTASSSYRDVRATPALPAHEGDFVMTGRCHYSLQTSASGSSKS